MIIDFHLHTRNGEERFTINDIELMMKRNGVDTAVVFPMKQESDGELMERNIENTGGKNRRIHPFLRFNPNVLKITEFEDITARFDGFKLHPRAENFDPFDSRVSAFLEIIEKSGKPLIIHSRKENNQNTDPDRLIGLASSYPRINFVFGHFANDSDVFFSRVLDYGNVYVETSIVSSPRIIERRVKQVGSERIIFGSDFPYSDQEIELMKIRKSKLGRKEKEDILFRNAASLLNIL